MENVCNRELENNNYVGEKEKKKRERRNSEREREKRNICQKVRGKEEGKRRECVRKKVILLIEMNIEYTQSSYQYIIRRREEKERNKREREEKQKRENVRQ